MNAPNTRFLLITAGNVDDERRAASYIQSGAREQVTVWTVDGADHTGGYNTQPDEWRQRVVEFLDEALVLPADGGVRRQAGGERSS